MRTLESQRVASAIAIVLVGALACSERWLSAHRSLWRDSAAGSRILVTTGDNDGPGSLREAIFAAGAVDGRATIVMRTRLIRVETELPPLVNAHGITVDATASGTEIDAHDLAGAAVLKILSPDGLVEGLRISGTTGAGVLVNAPRVHVRAVEIAGCAEGITLGERAADVVIEESRFQANGAGIALDHAAPGVIVRHNRFERHDQAAIRAVSPERRPTAFANGLIVRANQFEDDRVALMLGDIDARVEHNIVRRAREAAMVLKGGGASVRANRMGEGAGLGVLADESDAALLEANEIDHNATGGILIRAGGGTIARANRLYENGYGIAVVLGDRARPHVVRDNLLLDHAQDAIVIVGASPVIWENRALRSRRAALRILDFAPLQGSRIVAEPQLANNSFRENQLDEPARGLYRARGAAWEGEP